METLHSTELSSELAFFEEDYINDAIMSKSLEPKHPVTNIGENTSSPIDFNIDGTERAIRPSQCFIQINASLIGKKTVVTPATSTSTATTVRTDVIENRVHCGIINNIGHAFFKNEFKNR